MAKLNANYEEVIHLVLVFGCIVKYRLRILRISIILWRVVCFDIILWLAHIESVAAVGSSFTKMAIDDDKPENKQMREGYSSFYFRVKDELSTKYVYYYFYFLI